MMEGSGTLEEQLAAIGIKVRHPAFLPLVVAIYGPL
jgi:hypothetical protein